MRTYWWIGLLALASTGCTSHQLRRSTIDQARTLTDLQYQQVLDNLAMFAGNPSAVPWHVALTNGSSQVADYGSGSLSGGFGYMAGRVGTGLPGAIGSRTIVEQWGTIPVTNDVELRLLQIAYRRAFGSDETLDNDDFANDLAHELKKQVSVTDDFKPLYDNLYQDPQTLKEVHRFYLMLKDIGVTRTEFQILNEFILATNDDRIIQEGESVASGEFHSSRTNPLMIGAALALTQDELKIVDAEMKAQKLTSSPLNAPFRKTATPVIQEVRRLVKDTEDGIDKIRSGWFGVGCRKGDVPADACFVGHYRDRCGDHYVWVCPEHRDELGKFTIEILSLSGLIESRSIVTVPGGPAYAPSSAYTPR